MEELSQHSAKTPLGSFADAGAQVSLILFCSVAWMKCYEGSNESDRPRGGGSHPEKGEVENFKRWRGLLYGYVRSGRTATIDIGRLGAAHGEDSVDNVDVVWLAPSREGGREVVGWYRDATVFRELQPPVRGRSCPYHVRAREGVCLQPHRRTLRIEYATKRKGGPARGIWYADSAYGREVVDVVRKLFDGDMPKLTRTPIGTKRPRRREVTVGVFDRNERVHAWTLQQANGRCECCRREAPFDTADGEPYLEIHHVKRLADHGEDVVDNTVALCPNCHREAHYGAELPRIRLKLVQAVGRRKAMTTL